MHRDPIIQRAIQRTEAHLKANDALKKMPKPRTLTEVSKERLAEKTLEAVAPSTGYPELDAIIRGFIPGHLYTLTGDTNVGKCESIDTPHLMYDGSIKLVQDLRVGDLLMGPDNRPRKILSLTSGRDEMYEIKQQWGKSYIVNKDHILSLKCSTIARKAKYFKEYEANKVINISVQDYLAKSGNFKKFMRGWFASVDFPSTSLPINPYFLGIWLGDGDSLNPIITTCDDEVVDFLKSYVKEELLLLKERKCRGKARRYALTRGTGKNRVEKSLVTRLRELNLLHNKHIPDIYRVNSRENRLALLAGIIDSDGWVQKNISKNTEKECYSYAVTMTNKRLIEDILLLSRSLGFNARIRERVAKMRRDDGSIYSVKAYTVSIQGNLQEIPVRIQRKKITSTRTKANGFSSFKVIPKGVDDYYGFTLDGDGLYLLSDCTVTHNTTLACNFAVRVARQRRRVLYFALEPENTVIDYLASVRTNKRFDELTTADLESDDGMIHVFGKDEVRTLEDMIRIIDNLEEKYDLIVIDHVGYFLNGTTNWLQEQGNAIKQLAALTKRKQTAVVIIAHLRKKMANQKKDYTPTADDIAGSGAFKQDSTEVMIVTRNILNPQDGGMEYSNTGVLYVTKTKCGPNGRVDLNFQERKANIYSDGELRFGMFSERGLGEERPDDIDDFGEDVIDALF